MKSVIVIESLSWMQFANSAAPRMYEATLIQSRTNAVQCMGKALGAWIS
jgi:hypothetical protein